MTENERRCEEAREAFKMRGHRAHIVTDTPDVTIIDWVNARGSSDYYVRYILSRTDRRQNLIVTGDLGDAVFEMWWNREDMSVEHFARRRVEGMIDYLSGKMQTEKDKYEYSSEEAEAELRERLKPCFESESEENDFWEDDLDAVIEDCMLDYSDYNSGFGSLALDKISDYIEDCYMWVSEYGRHLSNRYYLWIVGLFMACEQIQEERNGRTDK